MRVFIAVVAMSGMLLIPVGAIVLVGVASGLPIVEPLRSFARPVLMAMLGLAVIGGALLLLVRQLGRERVASIFLQAQMSRWSPILSLGVFFGVFVLLMSALIGILGVLDHIWMFMAILGISIASAARRRIGDEQFCAKCGYQQQETSVAAVVEEDRCPECGAYWRQKGGAVKGRRLISRMPLVVGLSITVVSFGWMFARVAHPPLRAMEMSLAPTRLLISSVVNSNSFTNSQMEAISRRTLSREDDLRMMQGLLDKRVRKSGLFGDERRWLEAAFTGGRMSPEVTERFFADEVVVRIDAPGAARVGQRVSIGLRVDHRDMNFGTVHDMYVAFGGYVVDGKDEAEGRLDEPIHAGLLGRVRPSFGRDRGPSSAGANPVLDLIPEKPGVMRMRAVMWVYAVPYRTSGAMMWNADGTPALPASTMWQERIDLEHEIRVLP